MRFLKVILILFVILNALFFGVGLLLPSSYKVARSVSVKAPAEAIHAYVNAPRKWAEWTAWTVQKDPSLKNTYEGPESGTGARLGWTGEKMGSGRMTLTASDPKKGVAYELAMEQGKYTSHGVIAYEPESDGTRVTWTNEGDLGWSPISRWFGLLMDAFMGPDFEEGLGNLKKKAEAAK